MSAHKLAWFAINILFAVAAADARIEPDFLMDANPEFRVPDPVKDFNNRLKELWIAALRRPETDMQRMAAETVARGHEHGIPDLVEAVPLLEAILMADSSHPASRFAAARALIAIDSRGSSPPLFEASQRYGADLRQLIEPVLANWDFTPARTVWTERLDTSEARRRDLLLAIRGLGQVRETSALPALLKLATDLVRGADVRLDAATAAGQLVETGLELDANRLAHEMRGSRLVNQLCSIRLLSRHTTEAAKTLLIELAGQNEANVTAASLRRLNQIDPVLVVPFAESAMKHASQHVREQGLAAYLRLPTIERIIPLSQVLNDPDPETRQRACEGLFRLTENPKLVEPIRASAMEILAGDQWQGQEQASLLLGALKHKPAAGRFVELLEAERPEVMVASAWALRKVAVPGTIPALIDKVVRQTLQRMKQVTPGLDHQVAHLFEACGVMKATIATPLMIQYIPRVPYMGERSRSAAVWALGWFNEGIPDESLANAFFDRINDFPAQNPESPLVKQQCVIALVRMKAVEKASLIREFVAKGTPPDRLGLSMRWAIKELTGEELPEAVPRTVDQGVWFLEPLR